MKLLMCTCHVPSNYIGLSLFLDTINNDKRVIPHQTYEQPKISIVLTMVREGSYPKHDQSNFSMAPTQPGVGFYMKPMNNLRSPQAQPRLVVLFTTPASEKDGCQWKYNVYVLYHLLVFYISCCYHDLAFGLVSYVLSTFTLLAVRSQLSK